MTAVFTRHSSFGGSPFSPHNRRQSSHFDHQESFTSGGLTHEALTQSFSHRRLSSKRFSKRPSTNITKVVTSLKSRSSDELGSAASSHFFNASHDSILEWISAQRMTLLPPEGSDHDKVLAWAHLFVERLHSFDIAIEEFAGDSYLAAQLAYGYCAMLLELGKENASALTTSFGFFHSISMPFLNLLERAELFSANQDIREQLVLALGDLVTLVASISIHFNKAIRGLNGSSVSIDIYRSFSDQIRTFRQRCEKISVLLWEQQLLKENVPPGKVADISLIKSWLAPGDPVVAGVADSASHLAHERQELTCLWMGPYLARFLASDSQILSIAGKPGSGKTVLSSVVVDHLQHPIAGVTYSTLYIPINARVPAGTSPQAIASTILSQLFSKRIGNVQLYQILSDAYSRSKLITSESEYEELLWSTLKAALVAAIQGATETVIVVDGVDESSCGEKTLMNRLVSATSDAPNVKLITFGAEKTASTSQHAGVQIDGDLILDDISAIVRSHLMVKGPFSELDEMEQETLVSRLVDTANGSFVWSKLVTKRVRDETKPDGLRKAVEAIVSAKPTITDLVSQAVSANGVPIEAKYMLLWLATVERPLYVKELATLLSTNVEKLSISDEEADVLHLLKPLKSLMYVEDELVYLRHAVIRTAVQDLFSKGSLIPNLKDRHADLAARLLAYVKSTFVQQRELSLSPIEQADADGILHKHPLIDFALRYWPLHLRSTNAFLKDGTHGISKDLQKVLLRAQPCVIASDIYSDTLTPKHAASLQTIILVAQLLRKLGRPQEAISLFHQAAMTSYSVLSTKSIVTMQLLRVFLELTTDQITSSKTEVMVQREEILLKLVECYKFQYGSSSESVITVWRQLSEHYHLIKEVQKAHEIEASIQQVTQTEAEHHETNGTTGNLTVKLKARRDQGQESRQTLVLTDEHDDKIDSSSTKFNFSRSLESVHKYMSEQRYELAESLYVEMWQQTILEYRSSTSIQSQERAMRAMLEYTVFLQSRGRNDEVASILSSFWQDFNVATLQGETTVTYLRDIAKMLKAVKLPLVALAIFRKLASHCEATNDVKSPIYKELLQSIQITIREILEASTSSLSVASDSTLEELIIQTAKSSNGVDPVVFPATENLAKRYEEQRLWRNATRLVKGVLNGVWPSFFSDSLENVSLPAKHVEQCIKLARRLGQCYRFRRYSSKEKDVYVRIYRALRSERKVEDEIRKEVTSELLRCYETNSDTDLIITVHEELLSDYTEFYGAEHATVVKQLWTLANLTRPRPVSLEYYQQIIRILNKDIGSKVCHPDAFEPVTLVASEMWTQSRYSDAVNFYKIIFTAFVEQDKLSPKLHDAAFVREVFDRYVHCLRVLRTDLVTLHGVMTAYRNKCKTIFGVSATITVLATLTLARLCQESKRYEKDAIVLYEELLKIESESVNHTEITAILETLYEDHRISNSKGESQSQQSSQRLRERFTSTRKTYGWAHEESLTQLTEIINHHVTHQDTSSAVSELNEATSQILSSTTSSTALSNAASTIASGYVAVGQRHKALDLTDEIYRQIILRDTSHSKDYKFELTSNAHASLIFLAQMRHSLTHQSSSVTEILANLKTEMTYFEEFERVIKTKDSSLQSVLVSASRLHHFLLTNGNKDAAHRVLVDLRSYFIKTEGKRIHLTDQNQAQELLVTMLEYVRVYQVRDMTRSVGIAGNERVVQLLKQQNFDAAVNLANATFKYLSAQRTYRTPDVIKFVFMLGLNISGRGHIAKPEHAVNKQLLSTSAVLLQDALRVVHELKLNLALMEPDTLNSLISLLGEQESYQTLSWLLGILWNSRDVHQTWQPGTTLALGRRYIMARYLSGDTAAACRLAEDIVYNVRRVHGARHPSALDVSILLSRIYTGMAQKYQAHKDGAELAKRFYKKSAALHENILRAFTDMELDMTIDGSMSDNGHSLDLDFVDHAGAGNVSPGEQVKQHFKLFKLAVQRLGEWPKEYAEYERLNADLFREFPTALKGVEGVERWDLKKMGSGKAESDEDLVDGRFGGEWALFEADEFFEAGGNGVEEEL